MIPVSPSIELAPPCRELLATLTQKVRVLAVAQIARTWWGNSAQAAKDAMRRVRELEVADFVEVMTIMARPELTLSGPVFAWTPGDKDPEFGPVAYLKFRKAPRKDGPT